MGDNGIEQSFYCVPKHNNQVFCESTEGLSAELNTETKEKTSLVTVTYDNNGVMETYEIDARKVNPEDANRLEIFAYCSYMDYFGSQGGFFINSYQTLINYQNSAVESKKVAERPADEKHDWKRLVADSMEAFFEAGNLKLYRDGMNLMELFKG